jgi:hypothetical protein
MDRHDIINGLKEPFGGAFGPHTDPGLQRTEHCLKPEALAAFLEGNSGHKEFSAEKAHLADCPFCLQQLSRICRSQEDEAAAEVPNELLLQAEALGPGPRGAEQGGAEQGETKPIRRRPWFGSIPAAVAMAAAVVLAVGIFPLTDDTIAPPVAAPQDAPTTRYADTSAAMNPRVLAPVAGSLIVPAEQVFHWSEVPGSLFYDVSLVDAEGEVLLRERVETTRWLIPDSLALHAGGEYYVRVDAYLDDERFLSSEHVMFSVRSDP